MNINEMTNYELYNLIFKPIFNHNVEYLWDTESILNGIYFPKPLIPRTEIWNSYKELVITLQKSILIESGSSINIYSKCDKIWDYPPRMGEELKQKYYLLLKEIRKNLGAFNEIGIPLYEAKFEDDHLLIRLKHNRVHRVKVDADVHCYNLESNKHWIKIFNSGDILIKGYSDFMFKINSLYTKTDEIYLSYSETLKLIKFFKERNININPPLDFQI